MKPCIRNRKPIALHVVGSLEAPRAEALRRHLAACEGCRGYFHELSKVTAALSGPEEQGDIEPSPAFHRQLAARIRARHEQPAGMNLMEVLRAISLHWRVVLPSATAIAVGLGILFVFTKNPESPVAGVSSPRQTASLDLNPDLAPTFANYQMIANHSLDKLDALLSEQGARNLPAAPMYTGSSW